MILYYREPNGDYLAVDTKLYYRGRYDKMFDGRAAAVEGLISSVCTTEVYERFLDSCDKVAKEEVPEEWLRAIGLSD